MIILLLYCIITVKPLSTLNHLRTAEKVHYISGCSLHQGVHYIRVFITSECSLHQGVTASGVHHIRLFIHYRVNNRCVHILRSMDVRVFIVFRVVERFDHYICSTVLCSNFTAAGSMHSLLEYLSCVLQQNTNKMAAKDDLATEHVYLSDTELYHCQACVTAIYESEHNGEKCEVVVTDRTVLHPQGGSFRCLG
jgi:hypothetical protein